MEIVTSCMVFGYVAQLVKFPINESIVSSVLLISGKEARIERLLHLDEQLKHAALNCFH